MNDYIFIFIAMGIMLQLVFLVKAADPSAPYQRGPLLDFETAKAILKRDADMELDGDDDYGWHLRSKKHPHHYSKRHDIENETAHRLIEEGIAEDPEEWD